MVGQIDGDYEVDLWS